MRAVSSLFGIFLRIIHDYSKNTEKYPVFRMFLPVFPRVFGMNKAYSGTYCSCDRRNRKGRIENGYDQNN